MGPGLTEKAHRGSEYAEQHITGDRHMATAKPTEFTKPTELTQLNTPEFYKISQIRLPTEDKNIDVDEKSAEFEIEIKPEFDPAMWNVTKLDLLVDGEDLGEHTALRVQASSGQNVDVSHGQRRVLPLLPSDTPIKLRATIKTGAFFHNDLTGLSEIPGDYTVALILAGEMVPYQPPVQVKGEVASIAIKVID